MIRRPPRSTRIEHTLSLHDALPISSLENYLRFVGLPARDLEQPPALPGLPRSPVEAVSLAVENNPQLLAAEADAKAARYDVRVAAASRLPRLSAVASEIGRAHV